jgi:hypothetical protein
MLGMLPDNSRVRALMRIVLPGVVSGKASMKLVHIRRLLIVTRISRRGGDDPRADDGERVGASARGVAP